MVKTFLKKFCLLSSYTVGSKGFSYLTCLVFLFQQNIEEIPDDLKQLYKTVWEISQKTVLKMAADRGAYIDQSQSLNIHIAEPNYGKLTSMHFYGWKQVREINWTQKDERF